MNRSFLNSKWLLVYVVCLLCNYVLAQNFSTEELLNKVNTASTEEQRLDAILLVCAQNDLDMAIYEKLAFESKGLAEKSGDPYKIGMSVYFIAWAHYLNGQNDSARIVIDEILPTLKWNNEKLAEVNFKLRSFKATTYQSEQNNAEALRILFSMLEEEQVSKNNLFKAQIMHQIAIVEGQQNQPLKAIEWEKQSVVLLNPNVSKDNSILATVFATIGKSYMQLNMNDSAVFYNNRAIESFRKSADLYNLAIALQRQAKWLTDMDDLTAAKTTLNELSQLNDEIHMGDGDMNYWMAFINFYTKAKEYDRAISLIKERLSNADQGESHSATKWGIRLAYYEALAKCYKAKGNAKELADVLSNIIIAKDSVYAINSSEAIAEYQTKYEVQKKENTIIEQELQLSRKNAFMYGGFVFFFTVLLFAWLHFRNRSRRQALQLKLQMQADEMKTIQAVRDAEENERKRIAADLHDNLGSYAAAIISNIDQLEVSTKDYLNIHELKGNSHAMVSLLNDTIWALKKEKLYLTAISDRVKLLIQRLSPSYQAFHLEVVENIEDDILLQPSQAYQLFSIIHEAVNNALRHSKGSVVSVSLSSDKSGLATVCISDNGSGIAKEIEAIQSGNGIFNMKQRASVLDWNIHWNQNPDAGLTVLLTNKK